MPLDPKKRVVLRKGASPALQRAADDINALLDWFDIADAPDKSAALDKVLRDREPGPSDDVS